MKTQVEARFSSITLPPMTLAANDTATLLNRITIDPGICHGKPVIRSLRYPVDVILEYLAGGDSFEDVLAEFPDLEREDLQACIQFAAQSLKLRGLHLVAA
jgi:uncharacterized protein (DUF433 family)